MRLQLHSTILSRRVQDCGVVLKSLTFLPLRKEQDIECNPFLTMGLTILALLAAFGEGKC